MSPAAVAGRAAVQLDPTLGLTKAERLALLDAANGALKLGPDGWRRETSGFFLHHPATIENLVGRGKLILQRRVFQESPDLAAPTLRGHRDASLLRRRRSKIAAFEAQQRRVRR